MFQRGNRIKGMSERTDLRFVREIQKGKTPMKFLGGFIVGMRGLFGRSEIAQQMPLSFEGNVRSVLTKFASSSYEHAFEAGSVAFLGPSISSILRVGAFSKICLSIVQTVVISVVTEFAMPALQNFSMHFYDLCFSFFANSPLCVK